ncbi:MAG: hypothetical protein LBT12_07165 [Oscillospiraceae bacterium]|nr:hypothetical protein [Oscillospiraceae bacterium]
MAIPAIRSDECVDAVVDQYARLVYRLALSHVKNKSDADDVFQNVFLQYISKTRGFVCSKRGYGLSRERRRGCES